MKLLGYFVLLFLISVVSSRQRPGQRRHRNPWLLHKRLLPNSKIKCQIPWRKCAALKNCTARLNCVHQNYKCLERARPVPTTPTNITTNTTTNTPTNITSNNASSNQIQLMDKCKERIDKCLTKNVQCKRKVSCIFFRIYQCERLQDNIHRLSKRISKKTWAVKIKKKIKRKRKRIMKIKRKIKRKNKRRSRKRKFNRKRNRKRNQKRNRKP